ncbi:MAG TPA: hypothetical protein VGK34_04375 [Armatimonadota bacterium]|jgi:hypothetical protein
MPKFMMEVHHEPDEHLNSLDRIAFYNPELLNGMKWGCRNGEHTGWVLVDANDENEAREMLPQNERNGVRLAEVDTLTEDDIARMHKGLQG